MPDPKGLAPFRPTPDGPAEAAQLPLFCYGTLLDPQFMARMLGRALPCEPALLDGYRAQVLPTFNWPVLVRAPEATVSGRLYRGLNKEDLRRLDAYEGVEEGLYLREVVSVKVGGGAPAEPAFAYLPTQRTLARGALL